MHDQDFLKVILVKYNISTHNISLEKGLIDDKRHKIESVYISDTR